MAEVTPIVRRKLSQGKRVRLWKLELQRLADVTGLTLHVHHYPRGTSKWNSRTGSSIACSATSPRIGAAGR